MSDNVKFNKDLKGGEFGEKVVAKWLEKYKGFDDTEYNPDKNNKYDFNALKGDKRIYFEVKTDRYEYLKNVKTGNIFIETMCSGKLSGVHTTKSDIFVYFFPDFEEAFTIKVSDLKELIKTPGLRITEKSGDGGRVKGVLIPREEFRNRFNILKIKRLNRWNTIHLE